MPNSSKCTGARTSPSVLQSNPPREHPTNPRGSSPLRSPAVWIVLGVIVLIWLGGVGVSIWFGSERLAWFGDIFGAQNALFSGLALAGVVMAIFLQRQELQLQREELAATRAELSRQATAAENSEKALEAQRRAMLLSAAVSASTGLVAANTIHGVCQVRSSVDSHLRVLLDEILAALPLELEEVPRIDSGIR
jgi:hypothetical protein